MPRWFQQATHDPAPEGHTVSNAINPNAANIRAALKDAGLEDALKKVVTGTKVAYVYVADSPQTAMAVVKTLSPLWNDSSDRFRGPYYGDVVTVSGQGTSVATIEIRRPGWEDTTPVEFDQERRARAISGPSCDTEGYPLQYLPRRKGDHEPWAANERTEIRYGNAWVEEWTPVRDPQTAQDEAEALNARELDRRPVAVKVRTEDAEREYRTKRGTHAIGRLVARSKCRRNRRR